MKLAAYIRVILLIVPLYARFYSTLAANAVSDSSYDLLIRHSKVYDPRSGLEGRYDIAIRGGKIVRIGKRLDPSMANKVVNARGLRAVPGLIDIHTHVFAGSQPGKFANGTSSVNPDLYCPMNGITTVVDAGTSGWRNFEDFHKQIIHISRTRVLAFLNIFGSGMSGKPLEEDTSDLQWDPVKKLLEAYPRQIIGFKVGHFTREGTLPMQKAREMGDLANLPVFVECHLPNIPLEVQLSYMKQGDIMTHCFEQVEERQPFVQEDGTIAAGVLKAGERGVLFDLGHGGVGFWFDQSMSAIERGFLPNTFGTDLHRNSMSASMKSLPNVMSKFLAMGVSFREIIDRCTWNAAQAIRQPTLGHLTEGGVADLALLRVERGNYGFIDAAGKRISGKKRIIAEMTIRDGKVIWDLQGRTAETWK